MSQPLSDMVSSIQKMIKKKEERKEKQIPSLNAFKKRSISSFLKKKNEKTKEKMI